MKERETNKKTTNDLSKIKCQHGVKTPKSEQSQRDRHKYRQLWNDDFKNFLSLPTACCIITCWHLCVNRWICDSVCISFVFNIIIITIIWSFCKRNDEHNERHTANNIWKIKPDWMSCTNHHFQMVDSVREARKYDTRKQASKREIERHSW